MGWSYRVVKDNFKEKFHCEGKECEHEFTSFNIHEVHYDQQEDCRGGASCCCPIQSVSLNPIKPHGTTPEDLKGDLELMLKAFDRPILIQQEIDHLFTEPEEDDEDVPDDIDYAKLETDADIKALQDIALPQEKKDETQS